MKDKLAEKAINLDKEIKKRLRQENRQARLDKLEEIDENGYR